MNIKFSYILIAILTAIVWSGCERTEILESYEEIKDNEPLPICFVPYLSTPSSATTRADLNYLSSFSSSTGSYRLSHFQFIPWLGAKIGVNGYYNVSTKPEYNYRFGMAANNSYIVGIFAFSHGTESWNDIRNDETKLNQITANLMTNQPLLHLAKSGQGSKINHDYANGQAFWDYTPRKFWPNNPDNKVTFISYYPFQDYETLADGTTPGPYYRAGAVSKRQNAPASTGTINGVSYDIPNYTEKADDADLRYITPPAYGAHGKDAFSFKFTQRRDVKNHIDFLLGINQNETRRGISENSADSIMFQLKHSLCAVWFDFSVDETQANWGKLDGQTVPSSIEIKVNSIGFRNLYTKGEVYPYVDSDNVKFKWSNLDNYDDTDRSQFGGDDKDAYMVTFDINDTDTPNPPFIKDRQDDRPVMTFNGSSWTYEGNSKENIYYNHKDGLKNSDKYGENSRGLRYLLLVVPQKAEKDKNGEAKDSYLEVNYNMTYTYTDGGKERKVVYDNCIHHVKLKDDKKRNTDDKTQLFVAGKLLLVYVKFNPVGIQMDAEVEEWPTDEELEVEGVIDG